MARDLTKFLFTKALLIPAMLMAGLGGTSAAALAKKEPMRLKPSSKWVANYEEEGCFLVRQFGEGKDKSVVIFSRFAPGDTFKLTLGGGPFKGADNADSANVKFGPNEQQQELYYYMGTTTNEKLPALVVKHPVSLGGMSDQQKAALKKKQSLEGLPEIAMDDARRAAITYIEVGKPLGQSVILETGPMAKPMAALSQCIDNLVASWGIDVEKHKTALSAVKPTSNPGRWVLENDYPKDMLIEGQPAIVEFRLNVDGQGNATACHIQATTRLKEFDDAVCKALMKRAKFAPAIDAEGQPLASYYKNTVRFEIGGRRP
jgi:hypothetical protein